MLTYHEYAALFKTPPAFADDLMLVFQQPAKRSENPLASDMNLSSRKPSASIDRN